MNFIHWAQIMVPIIFTGLNNILETFASDGPMINTCLILSTANLIIGGKGRLLHIIF